MIVDGMLKINWHVLGFLSIVIGFYFYSPSLLLIR